MQGRPNAWFFTMCKTVVSNVIFKYSLHKFSEIILHWKYYKGEVLLTTRINKAMMMMTTIPSEFTINADYKHVG